MNIFIGSLSFSVNDEGLAELFQEYGEVSSARVITDRFTGRSRGFGFVEMDDESAATKAIEELNGVEVDGRPIAVSEARPREERPARSFNNRGGYGDRNRY